MVILPWGDRDVAVERGYRMYPSLNKRFLSLFISKKGGIAYAKLFKL
jgi:hypothetical protein